MTDDGLPLSGPEWDELLEDATAIADGYREAGWDTVVCESVSVSPTTVEDRVGLDVFVSEDEYERVASLVDGGVMIDDAEVYYRPADGADRRFALVVERASESETAVCLPLTYSFDRARPVLETALLEGELLVYVRPIDGTEPSVEPPEADEWITFSHDDPSLFLDENDVRT
ncbi:DUF7529 family protein [Natrarchaeobaculum sulfurireducens]|uniref:Uncharacterized protein n=1 Tax=Natrarchaeobaculum sulfurireducens TaxID=2044521 RepID=A0A346PUY1_9EURY|nr:hypothetical protein [Natrarchaeobaculum sulfurireducens]AXR83326.1 hypothetical protein AArcMg_3344 [Natrarchaeobaculum sulfurireducens]